jgi:hypothetical protein
MDRLASLILAGVALEAAFQVLRMIWEPQVRAEWNFTRSLMAITAIILVFLFSDWNIAAGTGLDLGSAAVGKVLTGLGLARATQWVHNVYVRTGRRD